jgi:hypothetical protein
VCQNDETSLTTYVFEREETMSGEETAQMEDHSPVNNINNSCKKKELSLRIFNGDNVAAPVIGGPFGHQNYEEGRCSFFLLVADVPVTTLDDEINKLLQSGRSFSEETSPCIFNGAFVVEVFSPKKGSRQATGRARFCVTDEMIISEEYYFSLILNLNRDKDTWGIDWIYIKQPRRIKDGTR